jgi:hypothetical protein
MSSFTANQIRNTYVPFIQNVGERGLASFTATPGVPTYEIINQYNQDTRKELILGLTQSAQTAPYYILRNDFNSKVTITSNATTFTEPTYLDIIVEGFNLKVPQISEPEWNTIAEFPSTSGTSNRCYLTAGGAAGSVGIGMYDQGFMAIDIELIIIKLTYFPEAEKNIYKQQSIIAE